MLVEVSSLTKRAPSPSAPAPLCAPPHLYSPSVTEVSAKSTPLRGVKKSCPFTVGDFISTRNGGSSEKTSRSNVRFRARAELFLSLEASTLTGTVKLRSSKHGTATATNPRGIPAAPFVDKVEDYVSSRADVEPTLRSFQEMIALVIPAFAVAAPLFLGLRPMGDRWATSVRTGGSIISDPICVTGNTSSWCRISKRALRA